MAQDIPKDVQVETKPDAAKELDTTQAEAVGGGIDSCSIQGQIDLHGLRVAIREHLKCRSCKSQPLLSAARIGPMRWRSGQMAI